MRFIWQHVFTILKIFKGEPPLAVFLKDYFKKNKQLGSRDRKMIAEMTYAWYRCGKAMENEISEQNLKAALLICNTPKSLSNRFLPETWLEAILSDLHERVYFLKNQNISFNTAQIFPFQQQLSSGIEKQDWLQSILLQPKLFLRLRKNTDEIKAILSKNKIEFEEYNDVANDSCLSLANSTAIDKILRADDYVVQDISSQKTGMVFSPKEKETWWDCCCGAGGKSLLLKDMQPEVRLVVSDIRHSILQNLSERFQLYNHLLPQVQLVDVADKAALAEKFGENKFNNIICDIPCSGSGTWARTPEQLYFFDEALLKKYSERQKNIALNAIDFLKPGGRIIYITCSVFEMENEKVVTYITERKQVKLLSQQIINGIALSADSMFVAILQKSE